ncbi:MAG: damage-control phosphatase ARMT1 family protein [Chloroflexota bacterium]
MSFPLPPLLLNSEPGSYAQRTFQTRIPRIVDNVIATNDYPAEIVQALRALREEIGGGALEPLREASDDQEFWNAQAREHLEKTWLDLPWYWAEAFFYRRVLEATHYFRDGDFCRRDPFAPVKRAELQPDRAPRALNAALEALPRDPAAAFDAFLHASLWGNRADLSHLAIKGRAQTFAARSEQSRRDERANLLVDDSARVWEFLRGARGRVDFICDNAGAELCFDLALVDFLLRANLAAEIVLHLKPQPMFVSDAMIQDALTSLDVFDNSTTELRQLAQRLARARNAGRLVLREHPFWVTGFFFHALPDDLRATLAQASLVISKGDANYRRLIGDCHWAPTTRFEDTVAHFPAPVVALRTLKAELIVGLRAGQAERLHAQDAEWLVNGKRGVIQFAGENG